MRWLLISWLACASAGDAPASEASPEGAGLEAPLLDAPGDDGAKHGPRRAGASADVGADDGLERAAARHIVIAHKRSWPAKARSPEEALARAEKVRALILEGADMEAMAVEYSDGPSGRRGGWLGSFERGAWVADFDEAVWALEVDELSRPVSTGYGYHIIRRESVEQVRLRHLLVRHADSRLLGEEAPTRTRVEAEARALEALEALRGGAEFAEIAAEYSDGPLGDRGADMGWFLKGELGAGFDDAAFALEVGEVSAVTESPFGLHILQRVE